MDLVSLYLVGDFQLHCSCCCHDNGVCGRRPSAQDYTRCSKLWQLICRLIAAWLTDWCCVHSSLCHLYSVAAVISCYSTWPKCICWW